MSTAGVGATMAVELRWAMPASTTTKAPRLQFRQCGEWPAAWSEWADVPYAVVKDEPPKPAPMALGVGEVPRA